MRTFCRSTAIAAASLALLTGAASAEEIRFKADLTGPAEAPPTDSKGKGALTATFDPATRTLTWSVDYSGLTGPAIAAHFHGPAPAGQAAPIEVPQPAPLNSPMKGSATLTEAQAKDLMDGRVYFNIHTAEHKPGEIRGQVEKAM